MAQILTPGFLKWDGVKFVLDDGVGADGPPGPPGPSGQGTLIFRPGADNSGNVYNTWTGVMDARADIEGPTTIIIDDSLEETFVDTGIWNLNRNTKLMGYRGTAIVPDGGHSSGNMATLTIPDGAQLLDPNEFENLVIVGASTSEPSITNSEGNGDTGIFFTLNIVAKNTIFYTSGSQPLFQSYSPVDEIHTFDLYGYSEIRKNGNTPVISSTSGVNQINLYDNAVLDGYTVAAIGYASLYIHVHSWGAKYSTDQPQTTVSISAYTVDGNIIDHLASNSISLGKNNIIGSSQEVSFIFGQDHNIGTAGQYNVIVGGEQSSIGNNCSASGIISSRNSSISNDITGGGLFAGANNGVSGNWAVVLGGSSNFAQEARTAIVGGSDHSILGVGSVILGGAQNSISGVYSATIGGEQNSVTGDYSLAIGRRASASREGQFSHGLGGSLTDTNQFCRIMSICSAINGGAQTMSPNLNLENGKAYAIRATVVANRESVAGRAMWVNTILAHCSSGTAVIDNNNATLVVANGTSWTIGYAAVGANIVATFTPTGAGGGSVVNAMVTYEWTELDGGV